MAMFWLTACVEKGGALHRRTGRWFASLTYATAATGVVLVLSGPLAAATPHLKWLVLYLMVVVVTPVQHGLAAIEAGASPMRVRSRLHLALNLTALIGSVALFPAAIVWQTLWYWVAVPAGFATALRNMVYANRATAAPAEWEREHLTSMLTAGIALHTTFFVISVTRWPASSGWVVPAAWLLPVVVGLPVIAVMRRKRRSTAYAPGSG